MTDIIGTIWFIVYCLWKPLLIIASLVFIYKVFLNENDL